MNPDTYEVNVAKEWARKLWPLAVVIAVAAGLIALLLLIPVGPADATRDAAAKPRKIAQTVDYGSGFWSGTYGAVGRTGDPATADVLLVGDSIGSRCTADIRSALTVKGLTLATITQPGQNLQGLADLAIAEVNVPGRVIMEGGTNNVFDPPTTGAQVERVKSWAAAKGAELYWVDTYVGRPATTAADSRNSGWVNAFIYSAIPYDHVIQWQPALGAAIGRGRALSYYLQDGVHPFADAGTGHADGCAFYAAVVAGGL